MWYVQCAAIILFCLWTVAMIGYSIFKLRSLKLDRERSLERNQERRARIAEYFESRPEGAPDREAWEEQSWVDAHVSPESTNMALVVLGALWFFPAFFFLCVFLFAGIR